ncbi:thioredoxin [Trypanosoma conorhini]|uniref:Thioredoxin n=1 Tax=Trypanosoma conorhini TaxID=83891 RepID=A0A422P246_9TRYP|nr:thioredoxin [Trypanosoma conorhini]RNF11813.1 thioredoxin [Trypanosoma conorhini]
MHAALGFLHRCLLLRRTGRSALIAPSAAAAAAAAAASSARAVRHHITSFHGPPLEFMREVNGEGAALVYFYTPCCEPCKRAKVKLQALLDTEGCHKARGRSEAASSSPSPSTEAAASGTSKPEAMTDAEPRADPDVVLSSASELCQQARVGGRAVRIIPVNTDENPKLGALHDIRSVPTFVTYRDGHIVGRVEGSSDEQIQQLVRELLQEDGGGDTTVRMRETREGEPTKKPTQK